MVNSTCDAPSHGRLAVDPCEGRLRPEVEASFNESSRIHGRIRSGHVAHSQMIPHRVLRRPPVMPGNGGDERLKREIVAADPTADQNPPSLRPATRLPSPASGAMTGLSVLAASLETARRSCRGHGVRQAGKSVLAAPVGGPNPSRRAGSRPQRRHRAYDKRRDALGRHLLAGSSLASRQSRRPRPHYPISEVSKSSKTGIPETCLAAILVRAVPTLAHPTMSARDVEPSTGSIDPTDTRSSILLLFRDGGLSASRSNLLASVVVC